MNTKRKIANWKKQYTSPVFEDEMSFINPVQEDFQMNLIDNGPTYNQKDRSNDDDLFAFWSTWNDTDGFAHTLSGECPINSDHVHDCRSLSVVKYVGDLAFSFLFC